MKSEREKDTRHCTLHLPTILFFLPLGKYCNRVGIWFYLTHRRLSYDRFSATDGRGGAMNHALRRLPRQLIGRSCHATTRPRILGAGLSHRHIWGVAATCRPLSTTARTRDKDYDEKAKDLNQKTLDKHEQEVKVREKQIKRPWLRQDADKPPAEQDHKKEPSAKGVLPQLTLLPQ